MVSAAIMMTMAAANATVMSRLTKETISSGVLITDPYVGKNRQHLPSKPSGHYLS
jgi:hypothetical protein